MPRTPIRRPLILALILPVLSGCGLSDFAARQAAWNNQIGMRGMNGTPNMPRSEQNSDEMTAQRIKAGEDLENEEARKAGLGPSPTEGMNCTTTSSFTGSANNGTSSSVTSCH